MTEHRALLVTDLVDSTAIAVRLGDAAMAALWTRHDRGARDLLQRWNGREIDRSDGFFMLFARVDEALGYARDYNRLLASLSDAASGPLRARSGIHFGAVHLRVNAPEDVARGAKALEADGLAKAVAARVMSLARGGQILLTASARDALDGGGEADGAAGAAALLRSHGHWRLKGVAEPLELVEAGESDTLFEPPPDSEKVHRVVQHQGLWLPAREIAHSLPGETDAFVGRQDALRTLAARLAGPARLVTVHGIGGNGKTRLALHHGWRWLSEFAAGVWFCDLSAARDLDGVVRAVAHGLQVPLGRADAVVQLGHAIAGRGPCLVILDNAEQVVDETAKALWSWLQRAPQARFVVTSRELLRLPGEQVLELGPMSVDDGVQLFVERAEALGVAPPTAAERATLIALVELLDGLPLAIELAAARTPLMSPRELLDRMGQRFRLLGRDRSTGRPARQATLRAMLDWSWELLGVAERDVLAQLSVFDGGATLAAIEATLQTAPVGEGAPLVDLLQSLVDKSLLRSGSDGRLGLLETVRAYAAECLATPGRIPGSGAAALQEAQARHWRHFAVLGPEGAQRDSCADLGNLVAATRRAAAAGDAAAACGALEGAWGALRLRGPFALGVELALQVESQCRLDPARRARVDCIAGWALRTSGHVSEARARFDRSLATAVELGDRRSESLVRALLGDLYLNEGRIEESRGELSHALAGALALDDHLLACQVHFSLGNLEDYQGRLEAAAGCYVATLGLARRHGHRRWQGGALGNLGLVRDQQGRSAEARRLYEEALVVARELGDRQWEGNNLCNLGLLLHVGGDLAGARDAFDAALLTARQLGHMRLECVTLINLAQVLADQRDNDGAAVLLQDALRIAIDLGDRRSEGQIRGSLGVLQARVGRIDAARASLDAGAALLEAVSDPLSLGRLMCDRAEVEHLAGEAVAARAALQSAAALAAQAEAGPQSELGARLRATRALLAG